MQYNVPLNRSLFVSTLFLAVFIAVFPQSKLLAADPPHHKATIDAVEKCLGTTKKAIQQGAKKHPVISCNIPFSFKEHELDAILTQSGSKTKDPDPEGKQDDKKRSNRIKKLINVRSAKCLAKIRVKTALIEKAIATKDGEISFPAQNVNCTLKTSAKKSKKIHFTFRPTGTFAGNCLTEFSPKMGNFNLDCTFCRLNFVAKTLSYWVNRIGSRMTPGINKAIGKTCS